MLRKLKKFPSEYLWLILISFIAKIFTLEMPILIARIFSDNVRLTSLTLFELWNVWDAPHYLSIAQFGYQTVGVAANFLVFLPLFPLLIFIFKNILQIDFLSAGYMVSIIVSFLLAIMMYLLTSLDYSKKISFYAAVLLFLFPTAFFLHIPYTESLFILLCVTSFFLIRKRFFFWAFFITGLASFTRLTGLVLIPALIWEIYHSNLPIYKKSYYSFFCLIISGWGFFAYLLVNYLIWGNFFQFTIFEKQNWYTDFSPFGRGLWSAIQNTNRLGLEGWMLGYAQIFALILGIISTIYTFFKIRKSYAIFMLGIIGLSYSMSFWLSMPRYILSLFPMYIVLAIFSKSLIFRYLWLLFSVTCLIILGSIFIQYGPVF